MEWYWKWKFRNSRTIAITHCVCQMGSD
jgi:hypothetical protein